MIEQSAKNQQKVTQCSFKCLTTSVHLDLLALIDTDSFLMALRKFVARRYRPCTLFSDQDTNFNAGERDIQEAFASLSPQASGQAEHIFPLQPTKCLTQREIRSVKLPFVSPSAHRQ